MQNKDFVAGEVICLDKPYNWTSYDLVKKVKYKIQHQLKIKKLKVGHAGTLDPLATGLMIICTGKATKQIENYQAGIKTYIAEIKLGETTPSFDLETEVDNIRPVEGITSQILAETLNSFVGEIEQVPPAYSAVKVDGKRAYELARKGKEVDLKAKTLVVDSINLISCELPWVTFEVVCSKGTYIRALARDIGEKLGCGAHLANLRRTKIGDFNVSEALSVEEFEKLFI